MSLRNLRLSIRNEILNVVVRFVIGHCLSVFIFCILITGCANKQVVKKPSQTKPPVKAEKPEYKPDYMYAKGVATPPTDLKNPIARRSSATRAAIASAKYQLISFLKSRRMENGITVESAMQKDENFKKALKSIVDSKASVIEQKWYPNESCYVKIRIDKKVLEKELKIKIK